MEFNFKYALGMTVGRTRSTVYKDWDKKVTKEVHGKKVFYFIDGDDREFKNENDLGEALSILNG